MVKNPAISIEEDPESSGGIFIGGYLTVQASDPEFVGEEGVVGAHLYFNGQNYLAHSAFNNLTSPVTCTGFMNEWHQDQDFTYIQAGRVQRGAGGVLDLQSIFATMAAGYRGVNGFINGSHKLVLTQRGDTAAVSVGPTTATVPDDTDIILAIGHSHALNVTRIWVGSATAEEFAHTFNASVLDASSPLVIGAIFDVTLTTGAFGFVDGTLLYEVVLCNALLSNSEMAAVLADMETRLEKTLTYP